MKETGKSLSELASVMAVYPQVLKNAKVANHHKNAYKTHEVIQKKISELEEAMKGQGRVLIRPSGTEPLVRVMLEGQDLEVLNQYASDLVDLIESTFGGNNPPFNLPIKSHLLNLMK